MRSVSTLGRLIGAATPVTGVKGCMSGSQGADVGQPAGDGGGSRHGHALWLSLFIAHASRPVSRGFVSLLPSSITHDDFWRRFCEEVGRPE